MPEEDYETQLLEGLRILARLIARKRERASFGTASHGDSDIGEEFESAECERLSDGPNLFSNEGG